MIVAVPVPVSVGDTESMLVARVKVTNPPLVSPLVGVIVPLLVDAEIVVPSTRAWLFTSYAFTVIVACPPELASVFCDMEAVQLDASGPPEKITNPLAVALTSPAVAVTSTIPSPLGASDVNVAVAVPFDVVVTLEIMP